MAGRLGEIPDETKELVELQRYHPTLHIAAQGVPKIVPKKIKMCSRGLIKLISTNSCNVWGSHSQVPRLITNHSRLGYLTMEATAALDLC